MSVRDPLVTVVIPARNAEAFLASTIESAQAQTLEQIEILIIDDGSSDKTADVARQRASRDNRIQLIQQEWAGVAAARNAGIEAARAEFIAPLDADDVWSPDKLRAQYDALSAASANYGMAYCWSLGIKADGHPADYGSQPKYSDWVLPEMILGNFIGNGSSPLIRRSVLEAADGYDVEYFERSVQGCEDRDLYLKIAERYNVLLVPMVGVGYRRHPDGMSRSPTRMAASNSLTVHKLVSRNPNLPRALIQWSHVRYRMYLAALSVATWQSAAAIGYAMRAAASCPALLSTSAWWQTIWRAAKRAVIRQPPTQPAAQQPFECDSLQTRTTPDRQSRLDRIYESHRLAAHRLMADWTANETERQPTQAKDRHLVANTAIFEKPPDT
jgi:glycosyltransferase involved in cell wall biosynthesis